MKIFTKILGLMLICTILTACGDAANDTAITDNEVSDNSITVDDQTFTTDIEDTDNTDDADNTEEVNAIVFTDSLGREVTVENPKKVVTLLGSFCDEWILAGGQESIVGTVSDTFTNYDYDFGGNVTDIGSHMEPDVEMIISLEPDLVIASSMLDGQVELQETLENAGITVAYFYVNSFDDYLFSLDVFTKINGRADLYEEYGTNVATQIERAKSQIDGRQPTVLFIRAAATSVKVKGSEGTVGGEILADLDTINIADSESLLEDLSMEAIILADPDYIFVTTQGSDYEAAMANVEELLINNPAWSSLTAVQNGNYYVIDKALYNSKPNDEWGVAYQQLADIIYPQE